MLYTEDCPVLQCTAASKKTFLFDHSSLAISDRAGVSLWTENRKSGWKVVNEEAMFSFLFQKGTEDSQDHVFGKGTLPPSNWIKYSSQAPKDSRQLNIFKCTDLQIGVLVAYHLVFRVFKLSMECRRKSHLPVVSRFVKSEWKGSLKKDSNINKNGFPLVQTGRNKNKTKLNRLCWKKLLSVKTVWMKFIYILQFIKGSRFWYMHKAE